MITPSFGLTATERVLPKLALDFTTASLDSRITFTRTGNTATVTNSSGTIVGINANLPRFDYNPITLACNGLLIEEARTNLLLNSLIDGTSLITQAVVTTAVSTTLSFYGTGQIVLSGTSSATVVGAGAYPSRKTYTFTPTAGALTLTVTGTVQYAQLEVGAFATSFIPTGATSVIRNADVATMTGTNFSSWYNASEGTFVVGFTKTSGLSAANNILLNADNTDFSNRIQIASDANTFSFFVRDTTSAQMSVSQANASGNNTCALAYKINSGCAARNGSQVGAIDTSMNIPTGINRLTIGTGYTLAQQCNAWISSIKYWPQRVTTAETISFSK